MNRFNKLQTLKRSFSNVTKKAIKHESFVYRSFFGELDKDYLKFPKYINANARDPKYEAIRRDFKTLCNDTKKLQERKILDTESFSTFELIRFFEAIGCSLNYKSESERHSGTENSLIQINDKLAITKRFMEEYRETKSFTQAILPILIHNALVLPAMSSLSTRQLPDKTQFKTAFAFCELNEKFAALPHSFWNSTATFDENENCWILSGCKNRILKADYEQYLVFCRVKNPADQIDDSEGIVPFLLSREQVSVQNDGSDNYGNQYLRIEFKNISVDGPTTVSSYNETAALNMKARGQLAVAALIYGIIRQIFCNAVSQIHPQTEPSDTDRRALSHLATHNLAHLTQMLYSLESVLYHTTAQFDVYDNNKLDLYLQATIVKTLATEYSATILNEFRMMFKANELPKVMSGETVNVLNVLDSFLESASSNRLLLSSIGLKSVGAWKFDHLIKLRLGIIYLKHSIRYDLFGNKKPDHRFDNSFDDLKNFKSGLDSRLHKAASQIETVLSELKSLTDHLLAIHGKEVIQNQIEMSRLASIAMSAYEMIAVIGRTNNALNSKRDSTSGFVPDEHQTSAERQSVPSSLVTSAGSSPDIYLGLCNRICDDHAISVEENKRLIIGILDTSEEYRSRVVHKHNLKTNGYFPASTFDRVV